MAGVTAEAGRKIMLSGKFSDLTIICREKTFNVHGAIICADSDFFEAACTNGFNESREGKIDLSEDEPDTIARLLEYLYTNDYSSHTVCSDLQALTNLSGPKEEPHGAHESTSDSPLDIPVQQTTSTATKLFESLKADALVYQCADRVGIEALKAKAFSRFNEQFTLHVGCSLLADILEVVYNVTAIDDLQLRLETTKTCLQRHSTVAKNVKAVAILERHEPISWRAMRDDFQQREKTAQALEGKYHNVLSRELSLIRDKEDLKTAHKITLDVLDGKQTQVVSLEREVAALKNSLSQSKASNAKARSTQVKAEGLQRRAESDVEEQRHRLQAVLVHHNSPRICSRCMCNSKTTIAMRNDGTCHSRCTTGGGACGHETFIY